MRKYFTLLCCWLTLSLAAQNHTDQQYTILQLQQDLDSLYAGLRANHPDLYAYFPQHKADRAYRLTREQLTRPMTRREFKRVISPFVSLFRDGHTFVDISFEDPEYLAYTKSGGKLFPLGVMMLDGNLYCSSTNLALTAIRPGDEIIALNGKSVYEVMARITPLMPGDDARSANINIQRLFSFLLWTAFDWGTRTEITYRQNGEVKTELLEGISGENYLKLLFGAGTQRQLHLHPEQSLAVIEITSYQQLSKSKAFIDSAFAVIKEKGIRHIALDLRRNGGGNSTIGTYVLAHITKKPFATVSSKTWLDGPIMQAVDTANWRYSMINQARRNWERIAPDRYQVKLAAEKPDSLLQPELFTDAGFYLITSGRTYSSAHMTALSVKCGGLGTIIGQPTGERLDLTGEIAEFLLPNTKTSIWVPTALYTTACGNGQEVGVQPDYLVPIRLEDIKSGRDAEVEFLKALIKKKSML